MAFKDLRELREQARLELPIDGKTYVVYDVDAETGLWAQELVDLGIAAYQGAEVDGSVLDDGDERNMYARLLGKTLDEMLADGVAWSDIKHAGITALLWIAHDEETAAKYWESTPGEAEREAQKPPNRASRRASAAAARTTRTRASTSGTKAAKTSAARKTASRGKTSSNSGG